MIGWSLRCALGAVALQCVGCAADSMSTHALDAPGALNIEEIGKRGEASTASSPSASDSPSASAPSLRYSLPVDPAARSPEGSAYLATESEFIKGRGISAEATDPLLESKELFSIAFKRMSEEESRSIEAQDLAKHYKSALTRAVGAQGVVEDLTCGLSLCMGSVSAATRADHDAWEDRLHEDPGAVRHVILQAVEMNGGRLQNRFLFSTDAGIKAIVLPRKHDR